MHREERLFAAFSWAGSYFPIAGGCVSYTVHMTEDARLFGDHLRNLRISREISLRDLARRVGFSPTYLSHVEIGHVPPPTLDRLEQIAEVLGVDFGSLAEQAGRKPELVARKVTSRPELMGLLDCA